MSGYNDGWIDMREAYAKLVREKNALEVKVVELAAENAKLREELDDEKQRFSDLIMAAATGHPNPCTLGSLCPYCEIERLRSELAALKDAPRRLVEWRNNTTPEAVPYRVEQQQPATVEQGEWRNV